MARRRGFPLRSQRSSGVARDWGAGCGSTTKFSISASGSTLITAGVQTTGSELTLLRTRGLLELMLVGPGTSDGDGYTGSFGIGVVTDAAFTAGIASLPTPTTDVTWNGWLYHTFFGIHQPDVTFGGSPGAYMRQEVDSKAMRKFDASQVMFCAIEVVEEGTALLEGRFDSRILFQDSGR